MTNIAKIHVYFDGAGPYKIDGKPCVGIGVAFIDPSTNEELLTISKVVYVEYATNIVAELLAAKEAILAVSNSVFLECKIFGDNRYIMDALDGKEIVKANHLIDDFGECQTLLYKIRSKYSVSHKWVSRDLNKIADRLSKEAIKQEKKAALKKT